MSLLTIAQRVADTAGLPRPSAIAGAQDQLARQMLGLANDTLDDLKLLNWTALQGDYSFNTVVDQEAYELPADFAEFSNETAYNATVYYNVRGSVTPSEWQLNKQRLLQPTGRYKMRLTGDPKLMHIVPRPQRVEQIVYEYKSHFLIRAADSTLRQYFEQDTDVPRIPEELVRMGLKWRIKHAKGLDYAEDFNAYEMQKKTLIAKDNAYGSIPVANRYYADIPELGEGYVPQTGYGN